MTNTDYAQLEALGTSNAIERLTDTLTGIGFTVRHVWVDDNRQYVVQVDTVPSDGTITRRFDKVTGIRCDRYSSDDPQYGAHLVVSVVNPR